MIIKLNRDGKAISGDTVVIDAPDIYQGTRLIHELVIRINTLMGEALAVSFSDGDGRRITENYMMYTRSYFDEDGTKGVEYYLTIPNAVLRDYGRKIAAVMVFDIYNATGNDAGYRVITSRDIDFTVQKSHSTVDFEPAHIGNDIELEMAVQKLTKLIDTPIDVIEDGGEIAAAIGNDGGLDLYNVKGDTGVTPKLTADAVSIEYNENADVECGGTAENPHFTLYLPRGAPPIITVDAENIDESEPIDVVRSGTDKEPVFTFKIPRGHTPRLTFKVKTLTAGSEVTIDQENIDGEPVITLGIPRGESGEPSLPVKSAGMVALEITEDMWREEEKGYSLLIPPQLHGLGERSALIAIPMVFNGFSELTNTRNAEQVYDSPQVDGFGNVKLVSVVKWSGRVLICGGVSEIVDATARRLIMNVVDELTQVGAIARQAANSKVFDTVDEMRAWLDKNSGSLNVGDNLYIRDANVPDYWWDGVDACELEAEIPNIINMVTTDTSQSISGDKDFTGYTTFNGKRPITETEIVVNAWRDSDNILRGKYESVIETDKSILSVSNDRETLVETVIKIDNGYKIYSNRAEALTIKLF